MKWEVRSFYGNYFEINGYFTPLLPFGHCSESTNRRPKTLREMEAESLKLRHQTTILELTTGPGRRYTVEINPVDIQEVLDQADVPAKPAVAGYERVDAEEPRFSKKRVERPEGQPSYDAKLVEDFLAGTYCLHGGTGWWKYEFCYGKKVLQYHVVSHDVSQVISPII